MQREFENTDAVPSRLGWTLLMFDNESNMEVYAYFFEMEWVDFLLAIRRDVNSFFGYLDGLLLENPEWLEKYVTMWSALERNHEHSENNRRVLLVESAAYVKRCYAELL